MFFYIIVFADSSGNDPAGLSIDTEHEEHNASDFNENEQNNLSFNDGNLNVSGCNTLNTSFSLLGMYYYFKFSAF